MTIIARPRPGMPFSLGQPLVEHAENVALRSTEFVKPFHSGPFLQAAAFPLYGDRNGYFVSDHQAVRDRLEAHFREKSGDDFCCVTGRRDGTSKNHTVLKNVRGGQSSGVSLVSFNSEAFTSYNKKGGDNAPVGESAMFAYTTALNSLLESGSSQRMQVGDASTVFALLTLRTETPTAIPTSAFAPSGEKLRKQRPTGSAVYF